MVAQNIPELLVDQRTLNGILKLILNGIELTYEEYHAALLIKEGIRRRRMFEYYTTKDRLREAFLKNNTPNFQNDN